MHFLLGESSICLVWYRVYNNMQAFRKLCTHQHSKYIFFNAKKQCFERHVNGKPHGCVGLTKLIETTFPVADHTDCPGCCCMVSDAKKAQLKLLGVNLQTLYNKGIKPKRACKVKHPIRHGLLIDSDLETYVQHQHKFPPSYSPDPCSVNIIAYLEQELGWRLLATQVPIYSESMQFATAIDLLCTDAATRSELYLLEIKTTFHDTLLKHTTECYMRAETQSKGNMKAMPLSRYTQHQIQLWAMHKTLEEMGIPIARAAVLRTSPRSVTMYELNTWLTKREKELIRRLHARAKKRVKRRGITY